MSEGRLRRSLLADPDLEAAIGEAADLAGMIAFEVALAKAQAACGVMAHARAEAIETTLGTFSPDPADLDAGLSRDGVVVPALIKAMRTALPETARADLHRGATSQDVIDTALVLREKAALSLFLDRIAALEAMLAALSRRFAGRTLMARTRMQEALEIGVQDRLADWSLPLGRHRARAAQLAERVFVLQLGGPVGNGGSLGDKADAIARHMARALDLNAPQKAWHSQRDGQFEWACWLAGVTGSLGKLGQDIALMAQEGRAITLSGGGGSSAMPHKANPVAAEVLVSLARHNADLLASMGQAMVHEQERSGSAWTLEWLAMPEMMAHTGASLLLAQRVLDSIQDLGH